MMKRVLIFAGVFGMIFLYAACTKDNTGGSTTTTLDCSITKSFSANVNPIFTSSCNTVSCHNSGSNNGPGALTTYNSIFSNKSSIRSSVASGKMPQGSALSATNKNAILCWIDAGAPNN